MTGSPAAIAAQALEGILPDQELQSENTPPFADPWIIGNVIAGYLDPSDILEATRDTPPSHPIQKAIATNKGLQCRAAREKVLGDFERVIERMVNAAGNREPRPAMPFAVDCVIEAGQLIAAYKTLPAGPDESPDLPDYEHLMAQAQAAAPNLLEAAIGGARIPSLPDSKLLQLMTAHVQLGLTRRNIYGELQRTGPRELSAINLIYYASSVLGHEATGRALEISQAKDVSMHAGNLAKTWRALRSVSKEGNPELFERLSHALSRLLGSGSFPFSALDETCLLSLKEALRVFKVSAGDNEITEALARLKLDRLPHAEP